MAGRRRARLVDDCGSAITEFVMISVGLVFLLFAVLQVAALFYIRNVVAASVSDAARFAAASSTEPGAAGPRAETLIRRALPSSVSAALTCTGTLDSSSGVAMTKVECVGRVHSIFVPAAPFVRLDVVAHALRETG